MTPSSFRLQKSLDFHWRSWESLLSRLLLLNAAIKSSCNACFKLHCLLCQCFHDDCKPPHFFAKVQSSSPAPKASVLRARLPEINDPMDCGHSDRPSIRSAHSGLLMLNPLEMMTRFVLSWYLNHTTATIKAAFFSDLR